MIRWDSKGAGETDDRDLDWSKRLEAGDSLTNSSWAILGSPTSLTTTNASYSVPLSKTKVFLSGGTPDQTYVLRNTVNTFFGDIIYQDVEITIT